MSSASKTSPVKLIRGLVFLGLCGIAFFHSGRLIEQLEGQKLQTFYLLPFALTALLAFLTQAGLTVTLCRILEKRLNLFRSLAINGIGGLLSLLLPMGNMGYKMVYLKKYLSISMRHYSSLFLMSMLAGFLAALLGLFFVLLCLTSMMWAASLVLIVLLGICLILKALISNKHRLPKKLQSSPWLEPFFEGPCFKHLAKMFIFHFISLLLYMSMYYWSVKTLGMDVDFRAISIVVIVQSVMMMVNFVPGNFVILESLSGWLLELQGFVFWDGVLAALLIRLVNIFGLVLIGCLSLLKPPMPLSEKE